MSSDYEDWLKTLPALGYDRDWVHRNEPGLRQRFNETHGAPMQPCPPPSYKPRDRYEEL